MPVIKENIIPAQKPQPIRPNSRNVQSFGKYNQKAMNVTQKTTKDRMVAMYFSRFSTLGTIYSSSAMPLIR